MGDPAGVGPEICLKLLQNKDIAKICTPIIFGSFSVLTQAATQCNLDKPELVISGLSEADKPCVLDIGGIDLNELTVGTVNAMGPVGAMNSSPGKWFSGSHGCYE